MSSYNAAPLAKLAEQFERLPGIGNKTAQRLAYYVLKMPREKALEFSQAIMSAHDSIHYCKECCNLTDKEKCSVCENSKRDHSTICVVEDPRDVMAIERTQEYNGVYHVLHGAMSPLNGIGPEQLTIKELLARIQKSQVDEVIMATLEKGVKHLVENTMIRSTSMWALCPPEDYPSAAEKYLSSPETAKIKEQTV